MVLVLPLVALLLLVLGGCGCALLLLPRNKPAEPVELFALSVPLGSGVVAAITFVIGFAASGYALQVVVGLVCVGTAALGARFGPGIRLRTVPAWDWCLPMVVFAAELGLLVWLGHRYVLGWDSLVDWGFKARAAALNGGGMPLAYYLDSGTQFSHPEYPLLLPLTEAWLFDWAGRADERLIRVLFDLYDAALLAGMYVLGTRFGGRRWNGVLSMALLVVVPQLIVGTGSATTAWADFVVALMYVLAAAYLVQAIVHQAPALLRLVSALCAALVWTKQEGIFLWLCLVLATAVFTRGDRLRATAVVLLPGLGVVVAWRLFIQAVGIPTSPDFLPIGAATLWSHLDRVPELLGWTAQQMRDGRSWGWLWSVLVLSVVLPDRGKIPQQLLLGLLVIGPLVPDVTFFVFSAWNPYLAHVESALPRLMEQVAPLAVLAIASGAPRLQLPPGLAYRLGGSFARRSLATEKLRDRSG